MTVPYRHDALVTHTPRPVVKHPRTDPTPQEVDVLRLIADGLSNAAIAARLELSPDQAQGRRDSLFRTLRVRSAAHAVAEGFRRRILTIPEEDR